MTDTATQQPIRVSDSEVGPYIDLPVASLEMVRKLLQENNIPHWVDHYAISVDGRPPVTVIYLGKAVDSRHVQELLDAA
ncbi:MAG: hypothetical protein ACYC61_05645 [Isosphaeraceae bacterium]